MQNNQPDNDINEHLQPERLGTEYVLPDHNPVPAPAQPSNQFLFLEEHEDKVKMFSDGSMRQVLKGITTLPLTTPAPSERIHFLQRNIQF